MMTPTEQLEAARTESEMVAALYRGAHRKQHGSDPDNPGALAPANLAVWLPECPAIKRNEAAECMAKVGEAIATHDPAPDISAVMTRFLCVFERRDGAAQARAYLDRRQAAGDDTAQLRKWIDKPSILAGDTPNLSPDALERTVSDAVTDPGAAALIAGPAFLGALSAMLGSPAGEAATLANLWRRWLSDPNAEGDGKTLLGVERVHAAWLALPSDQRPRHPLAPLVEAWLQRPTKVDHDSRADRRIMPT